MRQRLQKEDALVTKERQAILKLDITQLLSKLQEGQLKPSAVLEAYQVLLESHKLLHILIVII